MRPLPDDRSTLRLTRSQPQWLHATPGLRLIGLSGCVTLTTAPRQLAGSAWQCQVHLAAGAQHLIQDGGWISLEVDGAASASAELLCLHPSRLTPPSSSPSLSLSPFPSPSPLPRPTLFTSLLRTWLPSFSPSPQRARRWLALPQGLFARARRALA